MKWFCFHFLYHMSQVMRKPVFPYANNKGADRPAHPRSLISTFVVQSLNSIIPIHVLAKSKISRLYLVSVTEQAGLCFTWSQPPKAGFLMTVLVYYRVWRCELGHEKTCLMSYANNNGADQPAHLRSLISAFVGCCLDSIISLDSIAFVTAQVGLCMAWSETPKDTFCRVVAHVFYGSGNLSCLWSLVILIFTWFSFEHEQCQ